MTDADYVDNMGLAETSFAGVRLVVFFGDSGTGKSTAMRFLAEHHAELSGLPSEVLRPADGEYEPDPGSRLVLVDEIERLDELRIVSRLLRSDRLVVVASHVSPGWFLPLRMRWRTRVFRTDRDRGKIAGVLAERGVPHTPSDVRRFLRRFGSNVVDLDCVLERSPGRSLGEALVHFERFARLERTTRRADTQS